MTADALLLGQDLQVLDVVRLIDKSCDALNRELALGVHYTGRVERRDDVDAYLWEDAFIGAGKISLIDDRSAPAMYVEVALLSHTARQLAHETLRRDLPVVSTTMLQDLAERSGPMRASALLRLAIGEDRPFDARTERILVDALRADSLDERRAALEGMFLLQWRQFASPVQEALAKETDPAMRRVLEATLKRCRPSILLV